MRVTTFEYTEANREDLVTVVISTVGRHKGVVLGMDPTLRGKIVHT